MQNQTSNCVKVLLVSSKYHPEYSGSGFRAHSTYKRLASYGIDCDVVCNSINYQGNTVYTFDRKRVYRISSPFAIPRERTLKRLFIILFSTIWEAFFTAFFLLKNAHKYDLLHTFGNSWTIGYMTLYFSYKNKPIIRELCNEMINPYYPIQLHSLIKPVFQKKNTLMVAISNKLKHVAISHGVKNVWTRPNPIDTKKFFVDYDNKYKLRKQFCKFAEHDIVISLVANFTDNKNQLFALDVLRYLDGSYKLVLAGPLKEEGKNYFKTVQEYIRTYDLMTRVDLQPGFIENFDAYIKMSDVFLFPSKSEGLGTPQLEAQACGVPVVSNAIEGVTDTVIESGKGGFYLSLDAKEFARHIESSLKISKQTLIDNAHEICLRASSEVIDAEYCKIITQLVSDALEL